MSEKNGKDGDSKSKGDARDRGDVRGKPPRPRRPSVGGPRRGPRDSGPGGKRRENPRQGHFPGPRMELRANEFHVFVGVVEPFADDVIRNAFVLPAIDLLNQDKVDTIVFKARGQAINVAVRAALLLQDVVGVMQKAITISSEPGLPNKSKGEREGEERRPRFISSMEISLKRF
ncbi:MAG TPA: hypothetical protein VKM55_23550 [Candidatus Lokiarchaeia archaeon]|nr:hypothetical protein [Candidatus Lokiarchaeia archaeon]